VTLSQQIVTGANVRRREVVKSSLCTWRQNVTYYRNTLRIENL